MPTSFVAASDDLFEAFFDLSLTGGILFAPVLDAAGEVSDFAYVRLSQVAQRLLALPAQPTETFLACFPHARPTGIFAFYRAAYLSGLAAHGEFNYQYDGLDNYYHLAARRVGEQLLVSLTDTSGQPRTAAEQVLRESQAREQAARAEAERQRVEQLNQELEVRVQARTRQLSEQQTLLRQILGQVPASIATLSGPEHHYTFFNELYQSLSANRSALGLTVAKVFPEVVEQGFVYLLDQVYLTGEPYVGTDVPAQLYDAQLGKNRQCYVDFIYQPLFDGQRRVQGILAFILDVTDRALARRQAEDSRAQVQELNEELAVINEELRATNEELRESNSRLVRTNADLDTFVYTASHDLKAPINNIEGLLNALRAYLPAELLSQQRANEMVPRLLGMMDGAVTRFLQTIGHLTEVSRLQHTTQEPAEAVALADLIHAVRLDLAPLIEATHAQLLVDLADCPVVYFSPKNLRSIIYNLLSNALKYRDPARDLLVRLHAYRRAGQVVFEVQDNGLGLTEGQQQRLFGLFQRLHAHVEGTGVGLYMLKKIVENSGGTITVQSQPGVGSTFMVLLPAHL